MDKQEVILFQVTVLTRKNYDEGTAGSSVKCNKEERRNVMDFQLNSFRFESKRLRSVHPSHWTTQELYEQRRIQKKIKIVVVRVQLLDNTIMECTLTVENTGNDCLNAVANKLDLKEVQYFGLRYYNKQQTIRWVELDKPLKKQVDKNANDPTLYFGVMFYVANLELLQQEITRYLFYLQLKNNVIECRLPRNKDQAIELASYMLQAEFGDYHPEVHTVQYFRDFILFPEILAQTDEILDSLTADTLIRHQSHRGLTPPDAEYNYILKVMHLDGYGERMYYAKDSQNIDCEIGCSFIGIVTRRLVSPLPEEDGQNPQDIAKTKGTLYEWKEVEHAFCQKSIILINLKKDDVCLQYHMDDAESAKYACRMFECSRKFYSINREFRKKIQLENGTTTAIQRRPTLRRLQDAPAPEVHTSTQAASEQRSINTSQPQANFISSQENLQSYHIQQDNTQYYASQTSLDHAYVSQTSLNHVSAVPQEYGYPNGYGQGGSMYSSPSINSLAHSQTQLNRPSPTSSNLSLCSSDRHLANNGVPVYRCTPDYEQAVRQRRRYSSYLENQAHQQAVNNQTGIANTSRKPRPHSMIYSPQELLQQAIQGPHYAQYPPQNPLALYHRGLAHRVDSASHLPTSQTHIHRQFDTSVESLPPVHVGAPQHTQHISQYNNPHEVMQSQHNEMVHHGGPGNAILAASTPELANNMQQQQAKGYASSEMQLFRYYTKPPPPYPPNNSTSTPDLSLHRHSAVSASSPDLHHGYVVGQRHPLQHPVHSALAEGGYQILPAHRSQHQMTANENPQPQDQVTIIRGVCTSVEALHQSQQNMMEMNVHEVYGNNQPHVQHTQTSEQTVQAYLQQLSLEQQGNQTRTRHPGQHPHARHHRPVSYPPRLNYNHSVLMGVEEQNMLYSQNGGRLPTVPQQSLHSSQSHLGSSSSTVGSPYGSQQYLQQQQGSQISLQRSLAPATHPVIIQQPLPQHADTTMNVMGQSGGNQMDIQQCHPSLQQSHYVHVGSDLNPDEEYEHQGDLSYESEQLETNETGADDKEFKATPQHSQMPSNATMLIHSSDSESEGEYVCSDDEESVEGDKSERMINFPPADYRQMSLTTIDQWPKRKPQEMYVPPKPELQQFLTDSDPARPPPPYPEGSPKIKYADHDPPISYRKPPQMESCDEGDLTKVSVFPHPNPTPTQMHMSTLSETNPFYSPNINMNNPFYNFEKEVTERLEENKMNSSGEMIPTLQVQNTETKMLAEQASEGLRQARRSTRKSSKLSTPNGGIQNVNCGLPSPSAGTPDERVLHLERQVEDGQVLIEYEKIAKKKDSSVSPASGDPAGSRDRTKSVVPYLTNRVKLKPTGTNVDGYINASHVQVDVAGQTWHYIMGQSPLDDYIEEFWDMVWENEVSIIVMMTREVEDGRKRCGRYWPEYPGDPNSLLFGNYRVSCEIVSDSQPPTPNHTSISPDEDSDEDRRRLPSTTCENLVTSRLVLQKAGTSECRTVWHLQYVGWPDTGAPKHAGDFLAFLEELESVRRLADDNLDEGEISHPFVVHCTSGAGRSGVVVLCELMRHSLEHNETTTVPQMLKLVRDQRMHCVQTVSQYNFVYKVLILFLKSLRLI